MSENELAEGETARPDPSGTALSDVLARYRDDPAAADPSWGAVFEGWEGHALTAGPPPAAGGPEPVAGGPAALDPFRACLVLGRLVESYRWRGHRGARLDPLGLAPIRRDPEIALDRALLARAARDLVLPPGTFGLDATRLGEVLDRLEATYAGSTGYEFMHVEDPVAREWLRRAIEAGPPRPDAAQRRAAALRLIEADEFEAFMQRRFVGKKRFGAEGAEALLPALWAVLDGGAARGLRTIIMGGTSRARLNQLATFVGKPAVAIFAEVAGAAPFAPDVEASGDVAYHLGHAAEREAAGGERVRVEYCCNPSHLEAVDAVAMGRVRALQDAYGPEERDVARAEAMALLVHTDAAFAGQGVVAEAAQLGGLAAYETGGTVHVVVNNQVGFTTDPSAGRTSPYCTDAARAVGAPVLHVNADDVDAVVAAAHLAVAYRQRFGADAVIDLVCYRRRGHNELDEPAFTQPRMVEATARHPGTRRLYLDRLAAEGILSPAEEAAHAGALREGLEGAYAGSKAYRSNAGRRTDEPAIPRGDATAGTAPATGWDLDALREVGRALCGTPDGVALHPKVARIFAERRERLDSGRGIDWAFAEALALGTALAEGHPVRLSGQDTPRGAFSQRHFVVHDRASGRPASIFGAVAAVGPAPRGEDAIIGSPLAEYATLAFEYGYSLEARGALVLWEAQFGDFANVAQPVFDQFIFSGEDKWLQPSGLVTLLPHGLEGQGAEHSSARPERFLQMAARGNVAIANATTPANYFHLLRRQLAGPRRPLVVLTPKSLLRHRAAVSDLAEIGPGTAFRPVIGPAIGSTAPERCRRLVLVSGKVFWELEAARAAAGLDGVGLVRLEQLYPFPAAELGAILAAAPGAELVWCQEEPRNMGAWSYVDERLAAHLPDATRGRDLAYVGRPANPSPALGGPDRHAADQAAIIAEALGGPAQARP